MADNLRIILGIGNPGREYERTRHNLGFMVVDRLAADHQISLRRRKFHSHYGDGNIEEVRVVLLKPLTYVNSSGLAARDALRHFKISPERLLVICDDVNLPETQLRIRRGGSSGGHHGLESIMEKLGTQEFPRIRIGIGRPGDDRQRYDVTDHVLSPFSKEELLRLEETIEKAADATRCWLREGIEVAMRRFNRSE